METAEKLEGEIGGVGKAVGIRFRAQGKVYYFDAAGNSVSIGDSVVVDTEQGQSFGAVVELPQVFTVRDIKAPLKPIIRVALQSDFQQHAKNLELEKESCAYCEKCIEELHLKMNLVSVESTLDGGKLTFCYTAEDRVDFRELVKMLVKAYRRRIEMRQIGVRNRAQKCGGVGRCGRELCCCSFMSDFQPVSVRMAKDQSLSLNPGKISGVCGRLMCCLAFEHYTYTQLKKSLPRCGSTIETKKGKGKVVRLLPLRESVTIQLDDGSEVEVGLEDFQNEGGDPQQKDKGRA